MIVIGDRVRLPSCGIETTIVAIEPLHFTNYNANMMAKVPGYQDAKGYWWLYEELTLLVASSKEPQ